MPFHAGKNYGLPMPTPFRKTKTVVIALSCVSLVLMPPFPSARAEERKLPKVSRSFWGPTTLSDIQRTILLDEPDKCKDKEYKMEVKYGGGGSRNKDGKLEDIECRVFTGSGSYEMEFSFPSTLKQPNIQVGDYLVVSFVFSGATRSFFSKPNVVTAVERPKK
jgi:hypothetical protein